MGSRYARSWEAALKTIIQAANSPADSGTTSSSNASASGTALPFLDCPPERRIFWRLLLVGRVGTAASGHNGSSGAAGGSTVASGSATGGAPSSRGGVTGGDDDWMAAVRFGGRHLLPVAQKLAKQLDAYAAVAAGAHSDPQAKAAVAAAAKRLLRAVEKRHKTFARDAAGHEVRGRWHPGW